MSVRDRVRVKAGANFYVSFTVTALGELTYNMCVTGNVSVLREPSKPNRNNRTLHLSAGKKEPHFSHDTFVTKFFGN